VPGVEAVADGAYRRSVRLSRSAGVVELRRRPATWKPRSGSTTRATPTRPWLSARAARLDTDPRPIAAALEADPLLGPLVRESPGRRVPGTADGVELAVRAVLGQQVSLAGAATLAGRLVLAYGESLSRPVGAVTICSPRPGRSRAPTRTGSRCLAAERPPCSV